MAWSPDFTDMALVVPRVLRIFNLHDSVASNALSRATAASALTTEELNELSTLLYERRLRSRAARIVENATNTDLTYLEHVVELRREAADLDVALDILPNSQLKTDNQHLRHEAEQFEEETLR